MATVQELQEEERRIRYVRFIVDFTSSVIMQGTLSRREAEAMVSAARARILELFLALNIPTSSSTRAGFVASSKNLPVRRRRPVCPT